MDTAIEALLRTYNGSAATFAASDDYDGDAEAPSGAFCRVLIDEEFVSWAVDEFADVISSYGGLSTQDRRDLEQMGPTIIQLTDSGSLNYRTFPDQAARDEVYRQLSAEYSTWADQD